MLSERAAVTVRLALVADAQEWQLHHGQVTLDDDTPVTERAWRYSTASFLELPLPGSTVAALPRGDEQDIRGLHVVAPGLPPSSASTSRLRGRQEWDRVTTPWPRTEWTINRDANTLQPGPDLLVGDDPSFLNFDQALSSFLHQRPHDSNTSRSDLWRIVQPQRAGWLSQITIGPDLLTAVVDGEALDGAVLPTTVAEACGRQAAEARMAAAAVSMSRRIMPGNPQPGGRRHGHRGNITHASAGPRRHSARPTAPVSAECVRCAGRGAARHCAV
ncbi:hypothetical protein ACH5A3_42360 [Streptomyces echinatus]|uniref:hypothetical protein n=1 Tax=Streptomyces echinatus TaxID=67293 RepID=UPI0037AEB840